MDNKGLEMWWKQLLVKEMSSQINYNDDEQ